MKLQIKSWVTGGVLFEYETDKIRIAVEAAVKSGANLYGADLYGANLSWANLSGAKVCTCDDCGPTLSLLRGVGWQANAELRLERIPQEGPHGSNNG